MRVKDPLISIAIACLLAATAIAAEPLASEATSLEAQLAAEPAAQLAAAARAAGDAARGAELFHQPHLACIRCHTTGSGQSPLGPDLARLPADTTAEHLVESVLSPSKQVRREYQATVMELEDGTALTALVVEDHGDELIIRDVGQAGRRRKLRLAQIAERQPTSLSIMPSGQVNVLKGREQFLDLIAYLIEIAEHGPSRAALLRPAGAPLGPPPTAPDTSGPRPQVYRTLLPESGPASLAIGLGQNIWVCFDPGRGGVNYAWSGELDLSPTVAQKINQPAVVEGRLFFADANSTPLATGAAAQRSRVGFRGYRLGDDAVTLHYQIDKLLVSETLRALPDGAGFTRHFRFAGPVDIAWLQVDPQPHAKITIDDAMYESGRWRVELNHSKSLVIEVRRAEVAP